MNKLEIAKQLLEEAHAFVFNYFQTCWTCLPLAVLTDSPVTMVTEGKEVAQYYPYMLVSDQKIDGSCHLSIPFDLTMLTIH